MADWNQSKNAVVDDIVINEGGNKFILKLKSNWDSKLISLISIEVAEILFNEARERHSNFNREVGALDRAYDLVAEQILDAKTTLISRARREELEVELEEIMGQLNIIEMGSSISRQLRYLLNMYKTQLDANKRLTQWSIIKKYGDTKGLLNELQKPEAEQQVSEKIQKLLQVLYDKSFTAEKARQLYNKVRDGLEKDKNNALKAVEKRKDPSFNPTSMFDRIQNGEDLRPSNLKTKDDDSLIPM